MSDCPIKTPLWYKKIFIQRLKTFENELFKDSIYFHSCRSGYFLDKTYDTLCKYWTTARTCKTLPTTGNSLSLMIWRSLISFLVLDDVRIIFGSFSILKISLMIRLFLRSLKCEYADAEKRSIMNMYSKRGAMNMLYPQAKLEFLILSSVAVRSQRPSIET